VPFILKRFDQTNMRQGLTIISGLLILMSCSVGGQWSDENIDPKVKNEINDFNNHIIDGLATKNPEKIKSVASEKLLEQSKDLESLVTLGNWKIDPTKFQIKNQFHLKKSADGTDSRVFTGLTEDHDYTIHFKAINKEMFISVGYLEDDLQKLALTMVYGKYGDNWKLNILQIGLIEIENKDAIDWYRQAQKNFESGNLVDAALDFTLATECLKPANQIWQYRLESEINEFGQRMNQEINKTYSFPITVETIKSKPQIFRIFPQGMSEGYYPSIFYATTLNMNDTTALSKECTELHDNIGQVFKGLDLDKEYIFYRAFERLPFNDEEVNNYGFSRRGEK
jgi:hypothetical protein